MLNIIRYNILFLIIFLIGACSTSQELSYRPESSKDLWNIRIEKGTISGQFEIYIDDELIMEETPSIFTDKIDEKTDYNGYEVRLIVTKVTSCFGVGEGYNVELFIENELVTQMDF